VLIEDTGERLRETARLFLLEVELHGRPDGRLIRRRVAHRLALDLLERQPYEPRSRPHTLDEHVSKSHEVSLPGG
jgi:hypothetical protein